MSTLEDALRLAAAKGMTHLTLYPVHSEDRKKVYWAARATPSTGHSYVQTTATDPVEAVVQILQALPKAPKRKITAAVIDPNHGTTYHTTGREPEVDAAVDVRIPNSEIDNWLPKP